MKALDDYVQNRPANITSQVTMVTKNVWMNYLCTSRINHCNINLYL